VSAVARQGLRPGQTATTRLIRASAVMLAMLPPLAASSCIEAGYPLAPSGIVDIRLDENQPLFAADLLDMKGVALEPRQRPFETGVSLSLTEANAPAFGGFVTVRVEPRQALTLRTDEREVAKGLEPTCVERDGTFRCTADREGLARLIISSQSDWSGTASLIVSWADRIEDKPIEILPAGLPSTATNFSMIVTGLNESAIGRRLLPTYLALSCNKNPNPGDLGSKWREGFIRTREAQVRATAPLNTPGVVENAPVIIEALQSEALLSEFEDCNKDHRQSRLRVTLGPTGESKKFFLCFSDIGGPASFAVTSGEKQIESESTLIQVEAEPHLLRVRALQSTAELDVPGDLFEVSAFDVNQVGLQMPVDLKIVCDSGNCDQIVALSKSTLTLDAEPNPITAINGIPKSEGVVRLQVTPRLLAMPACESDPVTVIP